MIRWKRIIPFALAGILGAAVPVTSFGAALSDYDEQTQEKLKDNILEYEELEGLISVYNPSMKSANDAMQKGIDELNMTIDDLESNAGDLNRMAEDMKEAGNMAGYQMYKGLADQIKKQSVGKMKDSVSQLTSHTGTKEIRSAKYALTQGSQGLMILYQTMNVQKDAALKSKELAEAAYASALTQKGLNMVTDTDVLNAKKNLDLAVSGLAKVDAGLINIRQNLCMMTGWSYDASPEIRPIPAVTQERLDAMNLELDIPKAIGNNQTLIAQRNTTASAARHMSVKDKEKRARSIAESEQKLHIEMNQLYDAVQEKKTAADGAAAAYAGAVTGKQGADLKYQAGAIGRLEHLQEEAAFLSQRAAKEGADLALLQAVNDYEWAVKGILVIQ